MKTETIGPRPQSTVGTARDVDAQSSVALVKQCRPGAVEVVLDG